MTDLTLCEYHAIETSVRLIQDGSDHYRVELRFADTRSETRNRTYPLYSFAVAHKWFIEMVQKSAIAESVTSIGALFECRDAFREYWEQEDATEGKRIRGLVAEQVASL
jgi:hypothetical protein